MPRNIEIKARVRDPEALEARAAAVADEGPTYLVQEDVFFRVQRGRLKLRRLGDGAAELIAYARADTPEAKLSDYAIAHVPSPGAMQQVLAMALGEEVVVRKTRTLYLAGPTRIHLDQVEGLGHFMELEVVLEDGQSVHEGEAIARDLMTKLDIAETDLVSGAYADMLRAGGA